MTVRALVLTGFGINCEEETAAAFRLAGAEASIAHLSELLLERVALADHDLLCLPGGFSFGDDLGSGRLLANTLAFRRLASGRPFLEALQAFLREGGFVLGICNGFQALVKLGLLPNLSGRLEPEATLARNDSNRFEDRWCELAATPASSPAFAGLERLRLPVRHGEGKLLLRDESVRRAVVEGRLNVLTYCDEAGRPTDAYPLNPNGAELACAALTDPSRRVLGMMPHPEAFLSAYNDPCWPQRRREGRLGDERGEGLRIFENLVAAARGHALERTGRAAVGGVA